MSSTDLNKAAEEAARLSEMFAGIVALGPALKELGSLDQAIEDRKAKIVGIDKQMLAAQAEADEHAKVLRDSLAVIKGDIRNRTEDLKQAQERVRDEKRKAEVEAGAIIDAARINAAKIQADAEKAADAILSKALAKASSYQPAIDLATDKLQSLNDQIVLSQDRLDAINTQIAALRAKF